MHHMLSILILFSLVITGMFPYARNVDAATYTFTQTNWSGEESATPAVHPTNQSSWTAYSTKDADISVINSGADLQLGTAQASIVQTDSGSTNTGFNLTGKSFSSTEIVGTGDSASAKLTQAGVSWSMTLGLSGTNYGAYSENFGAPTKVLIGSDGFARIVTEGDYRILFVRCLNASCSSATSTEFAYGNQSNRGLSFVMKSGDIPVIARYQYTNGVNPGDLLLYTCNTASCEGYSTVELDTVGDVGVANSMSIGSNGLPIIAYQDTTNQDLKVIRCTDATCSQRETNVIDSTNIVIKSTSIAVGSDGLARIVYTDSTNKAVKFIKCTNVSCSAAGSPVTIYSGSGSQSGFHVRIALASDDTPRIAYLKYEVSINAYLINLVQCTANDCSTLGTPQQIDSEPVIGPDYGYSIGDILLNASDYPRFAYHTQPDGNYSGKLKYAECGTTNCSTVTNSQIEGSVGYRIPSSAVTSDGLVRVAYYDPTNLKMRYAYQVASYNSSGTFTSGYIDVGYGVASWGNLSWTSSNGQTVTIKARTSNSSTMSGAPAFSSCSNISSGGTVASGGCSTVGHRYIQYEASLSGNTVDTPSLDDVTISNLAYASSATLTSSAYNTSDSANAMGEVIWDEDSTLPSGTAVTISVRTAATEGGLTGASWSDFTNATSGCSKASATVTCSTLPAGLTSGANDQWFQYKITLESSGRANTPTVSEVRIKYVVNAAPDFDASYGGGTGISVSQSSDSASANWGKVEITYKVRDVDTSSGTTNPGQAYVTFKYNIGAGWVDMATSTLVSGESGLKTVTASYAEYSVVWDARTSIPNTYTTAAQIMVIVNDNEAANRVGTSTSAAFTIDTTAPAVSNFYYDATADTVYFKFTDNSNLSYNLSNNSDLSSDGTNNNSGTWQAAGAASASTSAAWTAGTSGTTEVIYYSVRDIYNNQYATTTATIAGAMGNFDLKDVSNVNANDYRLFISWDVYVNASNATFARYEVYRSTTSESSGFSVVSTITDRDTNYLADFGLASTTTYYYKVRMIDSNSDISPYTAVLSDLPNGQGGTDSGDPVISAVATATTSVTWAKITWTTDELSNSYVDYSVSPSVAFGSTASSSAMVTAHEVTLTGLLPNTTYLYQVRSQDVLNNQGTDSNSGAGYSFTTKQGTTISAVAVESTSDASAVVTWNTNTPANSYVVYSTNLDGARNDTGTTEVGSSTLVSTVSNSVYQHRVTMTGLTEATQYYFYVKSTDADGNTAKDTNGGNMYRFTTTQDRKPPVISSVDAPVLADTSAVITWTTDEQSDSQVEWGTSTGSYPNTTTLDSTLTINHVVSITGLSATTKYYYRVISKDAQSNSATSDENDFTTAQTGEIQVIRVGGGGGGATTDTQPPGILNVKVDEVNAFDAKISFDTTELTSGFALYGKTADYGLIAGSSELNTHHVIRLTGLRLGTEYHYKVRAQDKGGNFADSGDFSFQTKFASEALEDLVTLENAAQFQDQLEGLVESVLPSLKPPFIGKVNVDDVAERTAKISWQTNIPTFATVRYAADSDYDSKRDNPYANEVGQATAKISSHAVELSGLEPSTVYHFQIQANAIPGVVAKSNDVTFVTKALKIKPEVTRIGNTDFEVRWVTPEKTTSNLEHKNLRTGAVSTIGDTEQVTTHSIKVENLTPDTSYQIRVYGYDEKTNIVEGEPITVRTKLDTVPPVITGIRVDNALVPGRTDRLQSVVSWHTEEPANSIVYFEEGVGGLSTVLSNKVSQERVYTTDHIIIVTGFKPSTVYRIQVASADESGNVATSAARTILTPRSAETVVDIIIKNLQETFGFLNRLR